MTTGATGQLGLALPVQGELSGTWGNTVNNAITEYTNIAIAATLTLTNDGAVTLANTTGTDLASNIVSSLTGAGTVTAQFAIVKVTGTLTTTKVVTFGSAGSAPYSKTYLVVNAATGGSVSFTAYGGSGVTVAVGESAYVYYNGTNIVKVATSTSGTGDVVGPASATANGIALFNSTTGKLIKDSAASDGLIYGLTVGRGAGAVATNTAVGASALAANTTGAYNSAVGYQSSQSIQGGGGNVSFGGLALRLNVSGDSNSAFGVNALENNTGSNNTGIGRQALGSNTTASNNTALGYQAGYSNTTSEGITAIGTEALYTNTTGYNSALGYRALYANTTGTDNVAIGGSTSNATAAMRFNTTGNNNTAVGAGALTANTTASWNTAVGYQSSYSNTTGNNTVSLGRIALYSNTTGNNNIAVGSQALYSNTTASDNTAMGTETLYANTTGAGNTALGRSALQANTTASNNTAVGYQAGYTNVTGIANTFTGYQAGYTSNASSVNGYNTATGYQAGKGLTTGNNNSFFGFGSGELITTGGKNSILGAYNGNQGGLDIRTSSNYIVLSDGDGNPRAYWNGANMFQNGDINATGNVTAYYSDKRLKTITGKIENALDKVAQLSGVYYTNNSVAKSFGYDSDEVQVGVIAQEVEAVMPQIVRAAPFDIGQDGQSKSGENYKTVQYERLVPLLIEAINELQAKVKALEAK